MKNKYSPQNKMFARVGRDMSLDRFQILSLEENFLPTRADILFRGLYATTADCTRTVSQTKNQNALIIVPPLRSFGFK